jgi:hypothetical protein
MARGNMFLRDGWYNLIQWIGRYIIYYTTSFVDILAKMKIEYTFIICRFSPIIYYIATVVLCWHDTIPLLTCCSNYILGLRFALLIVCRRIWCQCHFPLNWFVNFYPIIYQLQAVIYIYIYIYADLNNIYGKN